MYALTQISPSGRRQNELSGNTDLGNFTLRNSIWFMISSIMMQGVDIQPATPSGNHHTIPCRLPLRADIDTNDNQY